MVISWNLPASMGCFGQGISLWICAQCFSFLFCEIYKNKYMSLVCFQQRNSIVIKWDSKSTIQMTIIYRLLFQNTYRQQTDKEKHEIYPKTSRKWNDIHNNCVVCRKLCCRQLINFLSTVANLVWHK